VIAECKRRSPSRGVIRADYDAVSIARGYAAAGAAAMSVLTEPTFFDGSLEDLHAVREAVPTPLLRKDFIVSEYQLFEALANGADAVLLIVAALSPRELQDLSRRAAALGLDVLVEVHSAGELAIAGDAGAAIIGVNNRNLRTLEVDVHASETLVARMPPGAVAVSESGLKTAGDLSRLSALGYHAFLIGERFMAAEDPGAALGMLLSAASAPVPSTAVAVKICGITRVEDAQMAVSLGAAAVGFIMWPGSPRFVEPERVRAIVDALPPAVMKVGVFVNQSSDFVNDVVERAGLTHVQLHGDETPEQAAAIKRPVIKATSLSNVGSLDDWPADTTWLVDAHDPVRRGGTGKSGDWPAAAALARSRRVWLAGGLTPDNVGRAIAEVAPFGVDVSSGVEQAPGVKDHNRLKSLFEAVADAERHHKTRP
jgi:indole-3-glycerol phosphate synthase